MATRLTTRPLPPSALASLSFIVAVAACAAREPKPAPADAPVVVPAAATSLPPTPARTPTPDASTDRCETDGECVLTTFPGCCSCCPCGRLRATRSDADARERARCATMDCESCERVKVKCPACQDPAKEGMRARCIDGQCTLVETSTRR